ncbi:MULTISPECIES: Nramp family divalent metal transporter [Ramlibacter]|uniref:Nramp family divalent metal transporter n=1 Tax=Ramlibacter aquaticus TaxID=2780094 RepID=A0ABR9SDP4_9BURK|nr:MULTISPECIES: Nramp family divalent metal transporter [Ramlibacter]MBE7939857.1 Nramp family divalent metal transporter [Ramlibacter aquaticus]
MTPPPAPVPNSRPVSPRWRLLSVLGPGLVVMLADTDAGSIITAAQSGAQWGYRLLVLQLILVPILFVVQELTLRLGLATQRGHGELIRETFGRGWAWLSVSTLCVACVGALLTQLSGIVGVAQLFGLPEVPTVAAVIVGILVMVMSGSYHSVERVAIAFGLFELAFIFVAWRASPDLHAVGAQFLAAPLADPKFLYLAAANIGAVIMPWMVFYQQSAVVDKGLDLRHLRLARVDTAVGALVTQLIMAAVLIATGAVLSGAGGDTHLDNVPQIANALTPSLGFTVGRIVFALGLAGAALVATVVVCLTAAWGLGEVAGYKRSLEHHPREAPWFYAVFALTLVAGGVLVTSGADLVKLSVAVQVMNALLLPVVLGFLFLLARRALRPPHRLAGWYAWVAGALIALTSAFGVFAAVYGLVG